MWVMVEEDWSWRSQDFCIKQGDKPPGSSPPGLPTAARGPLVCPCAPWKPVGIDPPHACPPVSSHSWQREGGQSIPRATLPVPAQHRSGSRLGPACPRTAGTAATPAPAAGRKDAASGEEQPRPINKPHQS